MPGVDESRDLRASAIGWTIAAALCQRARAGVSANVLLAAIGCSSIESEVVRDMENAGVTFAYVRPRRPMRCGA